MKCTMHSSFSLSRHNWRYHINIMMREHTVWHVSITSEIKHSYTRKRLKYFASVAVEMMGSWTDLVSVKFSLWWVLRWRQLTVPDRMRKLCFQVSGNVQWWPDGSVWVCPPTRRVSSAGTVKSALRNWPGKDPAGRSLDDLYTSPVHPLPPASSARHLYQLKETKMYNRRRLCETVLINGIQTIL